MSILDTARQTLTELPISDILRERLSLAFDHAASLERQIAELQTTNGELQSQLQDVTIERDQARQECEALRERIAVLTTHNGPSVVTPPSGGIAERMGGAFPTAIDGLVSSCFMGS